MTWGREDHRQALNTSFKEFKIEDKIVHMVAEVDMVALKVIRMGETEGKPISMDLMQFMRIVDGKITEIWELYDPGQYESQID